MIDKYPQLIERIQSSFIDLILLVILMFVFANVLSNYDNVPDWVRIVMFASLFLLYEPICMTFGSTLGNFLKGIRVRKASDTSKRINFLQAFIRYPVKVSLGWVSFLTIHSNPKRQAIHDMASGSVMIKL